MAWDSQEKHAVGGVDTSKTASGDKCIHTINDPNIRWVKKKKLHFSALKLTLESSKKQREKESRA
jgi:hypothetical protein